MKDIEYFEKIINIKNNKELLKNYFCWLYPFTNENIKGYYSKINFKNKNVLTVTASGDHALNALLLGANCVETFDSNPLAKYYSELKIAGIKSLSLEEFILFFYNKSFKTNKYFFDKDIYIKKTSGCLKSEYKEFWDYIFTKYTMKDIFKSKIFTDDFLDIKSLIKSNYYLNQNSYINLKEILKEKNITYHDINLKDLKLLNKKYDIVLLSNIPAFIHTIFEKNPLQELEKLIKEITNEESVVVINYFYDKNIVFTNS